MINILAKMFNFMVQTFNLLFIYFFLRLEMAFQYSVKKRDRPWRMQYDPDAMGQVEYKGKTKYCS